MSLTRQQIIEAKHSIEDLLLERRERIQYVRQAPTEIFREFAQDQVDAVDAQIAAIRSRLVREAWA